MIELKQDELVFSFPEVHPDAVLTVSLQRTLRIPDDERTWPLPPGLGRFPVRHVDDFAERVPGRWLARGGAMLPMYQSEAMWLHFSSTYPFAVKVAAGKINAVTGEGWSDGLQRDPQDYLSIPTQPWLDGFAVGTGVVRQFVAMPLGAGYSAEEQLTGEAEHGGVQIVAHPVKAAVWKRMSRPRRRMTGTVYEADPIYSLASASPDMGLAPGGRMRQEIYDDPQAFSDWDLRHASRCFLHLANALVWRSITGENPPATPATAAEYSRAGLPWFDWYGGDAVALEGAERLARMKSVATLGREKGDVPLPENEAVDPARVIELRRGLSPDQLREGAF